MKTLDSPRVSVIIPCHNHARYLGEALASVAGQTFGDLELIVVDDGSTDDTPAVLAAYPDRRMRTRRTANAGVSAARNAGLEMARGEFIAFLDADDRWLAEKLEKQVAVMEASPDVALVFTDLRRFPGLDTATQFDFVPALRVLPARPTAAGGRVIEGDAFSALAPLPQLPAWIQTDLFRAAAVRGLAFAEGMRLAEDLHFVLRAYTRGAVAFIAEPLVEVRRHEANSYRDPAEMLVPVLQALQSLRCEPLSARHRSVLERRIGRAWSDIGYQHFWRLRPLAAGRAYTRALAHPGSRRTALLHLAALPLAPFLRESRA